MSARIESWGDGVAPSTPYLTLAEIVRRRPQAHLERARRAFDEGNLTVAFDRMRKAGKVAGQSKST